MQASSTQPNTWNLWREVYRMFCVSCQGSLALSYRVDPPSGFNRNKGEEQFLPYPKRDDGEPHSQASAGSPRNKGFPDIIMQRNEHYHNTTSHFVHLLFFSPLLEDMLIKCKIGSIIRVYIKKRKHLLRLAFRRSIFNWSPLLGFVVPRVAAAIVLRWNKKKTNRNSTFNR